MDSAALIPAFNEERTIQEVITRLKKNVDLVPIVVDDGSTDRTSELAKKAGAIVINHEKNKGKGEALVTGFKEILKNHPEIQYVIVIDADSQYDPEDAPRLFKALKEGNDYVTGCRHWKRDVPFRHRFANFIWRTTFNLVFGTDFKDTNCGYIGLNKKAMRIMSQKSYGGYIIENMMLAHVLENGLKIKQVPVRVHYPYSRGVVKGSRFFLGCLIFIIEEGLKYRFGIELRFYERIERTRLIFTKGK